MRFALVLSFCAAMSLTGAEVVSAAEIETSSEIDAVSVFPQGAEVTRLARVQIEAGEHIVVLRDLPAGLLPDSIRVEGEATAKLEIGSVDSRHTFVPDADSGVLTQNERKLLEDELERLNDDRKVIEDEIATANVQRDLIQRLAGLPQVPAPSGDAVRARGPEEWNELFSLIGSRLAEVNRLVQERTISHRALGRRIEDIERRLGEVPVDDKERTEVKISVGAETALEATLRVRYQVQQAAWTPIYDVRLATGASNEPSRLVIIRQARVSQQTGEDWKDVNLALSTTTPQKGTSAPPIGTLTVDFEPEIRPVAAPVAERSRKQAAGRGMTSQEMAADAQPQIAMAAAKPAAVRQASVVEAPFQAVYTIAGRQSLGTEEGEKRMLIDNHSTEPTLSLRTVPKYNATAFLYAGFKLEGTVRLLPGRTSLFRDGVFVGHGALPLLAAGEPHELGFGADDAVRVSYSTIKRQRGEAGLISTSTTDVRQFRAGVKNLHDRPVKVRVLDQLPISENEEIRVELLSQTTRPTETNVDKQRGLIAWDLELKPQEERNIEFGYQVAWPKDKRIIYSGDGANYR